jgi:hypothetical protein
VSANLIFLIIYRSDIRHLGKSAAAKGCKFSLYAFKFVGVTDRYRFPVTETHYSSDLMQHSPSVDDDDDYNDELTP